MQKYARGISLIEALITLLVLSIGLLGLAQLQSRLWSGSGRLHASGNAYLLGSEYLEIMLARQMISPVLAAMPPLQLQRAGTLFSSVTSINRNAQLAAAEIRIEWQNRSGPGAISLESTASIATRFSDTRLLLPAD